MAENQSTVENAKEKVDRWLKDGITTPGGKLPSERELGELLGIKRMTLRQALLNLEAESKIFRKDRKGWFVTQPRFNYSPELSASFQRAAIEQGREPSWGLLREKPYQRYSRDSRATDCSDAIDSNSIASRLGSAGRTSNFCITKHTINPEVAPGFIEQLKTTHFLQSGKRATRKRR